MDLKPYYDAAIAAQEAVQKKAQAIDALFTDGDTEAALAKKPELDALQAKAQEAEDLYEAMKTAAQPSDTLANFVPVAENPPEDESVKALRRDEFEALSPKARAEHLAAGGEVIDEKES
jgi:hypothetical protein